MTAIAAPAVPEVRAGRREWASLAVLCAMMLVISLDGTVLNVALPTLVQSLRPSSGGLQWIVDSYLFTNAVLLLVGGALADRHGRKLFFLIGLAIFGLASLGCALVHTTGPLIVMRAFMGLGAAVLMPASLAIVATSFTGTQRIQAIGLWAGTSGIGIAIGPLVGGFLLEHFWWGSVFLINIPIAVVGVLSGIFVINESRSPTPPPIDPVAAVLSAAGLAGLVYAVIEAPTAHWGSATVLGPLLGGFGLLAVFVGWERGREHPYVDFSLFRIRTFSIAIGALTMTFFVMYALSYFFSQELQFVQGNDVFGVGLRFLPLAAANVIMSNLAAGLSVRLGLRRVILLALSLVLGGLIALTSVTIHSSYTPVAIAMVLLSGGVALAVPPASTAVVNSLPPLKLGAGSGLRACVQLLGGSFGIAILGSLLSSHYRSQVHAAFATTLRDLPASARGPVADQVGSAAAVVPHLPPGLGRATMLVSHEAFVSGLRLCCEVGIGLMLVTMAAVAFCLPRTVTSPASRSAR